VLPIVSLAAFYVALTSKLVRLGVGQALREDYTRTARAKGLAPSQVLVKHAFRNGLIPATTASAINVAYLLGGAIVIEEIFALPGIGRLLLTAVVNRDFPTIQGIALVSTVVFALCSIVADVLIARFDPRVRLR
jgi:peptide/nickel transport system permease protein